MARIRTVKPSFWSSPSVAALSIPARLTLVGLFCEADDEGRFEGSAKKLVGNIYPYDDDIGPTQMAAWLVEIEAQGIIAAYSDRGVTYFHFPLWEEHQRISHKTPSRLPAPPDDPSDQDSCDPPETLGQSAVDGGKDSALEVGSRNLEGEVVSPAAGGPKTTAPLWTTLTREQIAWAKANTPAIRDLEAELAKFLDWHRGKGSKLADWDAAWRSWMRKAQELRAEKNPRPQPARFVHEPPPDPEVRQNAAKEAKALAASMSQGAK